MAFSAIGQFASYERSHGWLLRPTQCVRQLTFFTRTLARELGAAEYVIDPRLALGIDVAAHERTLETGTIAAVAGGVNAVYPLEHAGLKDQIATEGLIVGEAGFDITP